MDEQHGPAGEDADELLRRALIDPEASVAVALQRAAAWPSPTR